MRTVVVNIQNTIKGTRYAVLVLQECDALELKGVGDAFYLPGRGNAFVHIGTCETYSVALVQAAWRGGMAMYGVNEWQRRVECIGRALAYKTKTVWRQLLSEQTGIGHEQMIRKMFVRAQAWEAYERQTHTRGFSPAFVELDTHAFVARSMIICPLRQARLCYESGDGLLAAVRFARPELLAETQWLKHSNVDVLHTQTRRAFKIAFIGSVHVVLIDAELCENVFWEMNQRRRVDLESAIVAYPHLSAPDMELEIAVRGVVGDNPSALQSGRDHVLALWKHVLAIPPVECGVCFETKPGGQTGCCNQSLCKTCMDAWRQQENGVTCPFCRKECGAFKPICCCVHARVHGCGFAAVPKRAAPNTAAIV